MSAIVHDRIVHKDIAASIQNVTGRTVEFIASQEIQDRDGDVIMCAGINLGDFMRNPVFLGDHDTKFILGRVTKLWKDRLPDGWALLGKADILPAGTSARVDEAFTAIKHGARAGISIGFISTDSEPTATGTRFKSISLLEVSSVAVPSCPTCVITNKAHSHHHHKEEHMHRNDEIILTLKDGSPNCPSPNLTPAENARLVDQTVASITAKIQPALDELIRQIMLHGGIPSGKSLSAAEAHSQRVQRERDDDAYEKALRDTLHNMSVPLSKTIAPWGGWN